MPFLVSFPGLVLLQACAAVWLATSQFQGYQSSDSIMFVLGSIVEWRPFFWEQDRVGMLWPTLTLLIEHPFWNLVAQSTIMAFVGLCTPLVLARVLSDRPRAPLAVLPLNILLLAFAPDLLIENLYLVCNYCSGLMLGLLAITLLDRSGLGWRGWIIRLTFGLVLFLLAHWQYYTVAFSLGLLITWRALLRTGPGAPTAGSSWWRRRITPLRDRRFWRSAPLILVAFGTLLLIMSVVRERYPIIVPTPDHANPSKIWLESYRKFLAHLERLPGMSDMLLSLIVVIVPGGLGLVILRPRFWAVLLSILPALIVAVLEFLVIGTRYWPAFNDHHPRYLLGSILLLLTSLTLLGCLPWLEQFTRKQLQLLGIILAIVMALVIHHRFGPPHPGRARELLESYFGTQTAALREHNCQALGFSYWEMWPALWHAHLVQHEHGLPRHDRITAVGIRSEPLTSQWQRHPNGLRIWIRKTDLPEVEAAGLHRGLMPFELIEDHGGWAVYHTRWRLSPSR